MVILVVVVVLGRLVAGRWRAELWEWDSRNIPAQGTNLRKLRHTAALYLLESQRDRQEVTFLFTMTS